MPIPSATVRIRPLRFGFLLDPNDRAALRQALQTSTCLWGGVYNFLIPVPERAPARYRVHIPTDPKSMQLTSLKGSGPSAQQLTHGLLEAFQPDVLVETSPGLARGVRFDSDRVIRLEQLHEPDLQGRGGYGIDMRAVCAALYSEKFQFVQRHPPRVVEPLPTDRRFGLLFAAIFGEFPTKGSLADCREHFRKALGAKETRVQPEQFFKLFSDLFPLRAGAYELTTRSQVLRADPKLFYMDERRVYDIIEYWNLRALGWRIRPLPRSLAPKLRAYCEKFITRAHRPYPPPSNASVDASFLCSRSCSFEEMREYVSTLKHPRTYHVSVDPRFPRLWDEWGRSADFAEPQVVEHRTEQASAFATRSSVVVPTLLPEFVRRHQLWTSEFACTNVIGGLPGGATVIPWRMVDTSFFGGHFTGENIWVGREGVCAIADAYHSSRYFRLPSSHNVFAAWARSNGMEIEISPPGRMAEQVIGALGGLDGVQTIGNEELLRVLDRMANGTLGVATQAEQEPGNEKRRLRKSSVSVCDIQNLLKRIHGNNAQIAENHLSALLRSEILRLGMELTCSECRQNTWFPLEELDAKLKCGRCLRQFDFPLATPNKGVWSYRVQGPFAVENYAQGAYCVSIALQFLADRISQACTWVPSFTLHPADGGPAKAEADFGAFVKPGRFSHLADPLLILGECKTFGDFDARDFQKMTTLASMFPGSVISFCTLKDTLKRPEKAAIARLARQGRRSLESGQQRNPVLVLTRTELLGQFKPERFADDYPAQFSRFGKSVFMRRDLQEVCDFTQQVHLGIEPYHEWIQARRANRRAKVVAASQARRTPTSSS